MSLLGSIFNCNFLVFLAVIFSSAFLFLYFERKLKEQHYKMETMVSLVTSVVGDMENIKMNMNMNYLANSHLFPLSTNKIHSTDLNNDLIHVSDDDDDKDNNDSNNEDEDSDGDNDDDSDDSDSEDSDSEDSEDSEDSDSDEDDDEEDGKDETNIKILKINIEDISNIHETIIEHLSNDIVLEIDHQTKTEETSEIKTNEVLINETEEQPVLEDNNNVDTTEKLEISSNDFKSININLEETNETNETTNETTNDHDYKKLSLQKLRHMAQEKKIHADPFKLKRNELLKLLEIVE